MKAGGLLLLAAIAAHAAGCGGGSSDPAPSADAADSADSADVSEPATDVSAPDAGVDTAAPADSAAPPPTQPLPPGCDPLDEYRCALPWPSNLFLVADEARPTGATLTFGPETLPQNAFGDHVDPSAYRRMDGYGVAVPLVLHLPDVDLAGLATEYDTDPSLADDAPIVWLEVREDGVERVPYWPELDAREPDPAAQLLFVRPARLLREGTRYVVAFRGLKDTAGEPLEPSAAFRALRDGDAAANPELAFRQARFDDTFSVLEAAGVERAGLLLAWDFNTASSQAMHGAMLHMRDDAFAAVGESGPELTIDEVEEFTEAENPLIAAELRGTFRVPHYMQAVENPGGSAWVMNFGADGRPAQSGWLDAKMWIRIPRSALDGSPHGLVMYGHGQNGSGTQVRGSFNSKIANDHKVIMFACDMLGMSEEDIASIATVLFDLSDFPWVGDRLHQGVLNHLLLARAMRERLEALPEVAALGVHVAADELWYSGISQGGIFGATITAVSQDITRAHLGVPGNRYAFLVPRSVNFEPFYLGLDIGYPDKADQALLAEIAELLWCHTDPVSYYRHLVAEPFADTPAHSVLLAPAKGDMQVAVTSNEWLARSDIGIPLMASYDTERTVSGAAVEAYPHVGSGIVLYDFGNAWPTPSVPLPPVEAEPGDPHGKPRKLDHHNAQMMHFFRTRRSSTCAADGCTPDREVS